MKILIIYFLTAAPFLAQTLNENFSLYTKENSPISSNRILSVVEDAENNYWIVTGIEFSDSEDTADGYLQKFGASGWETFNESNSPIKKNTALDVAVSRDGKILVGTTNGLYIKDGAEWDSLNVGNSSLPDNYIPIVTVDKLNRFWLGIPGFGFGAAVYSDDSLKIYWSENSFYGIDDLNFIEVDSSNNIWIGTDYYGLYSYDGTEWKKYIEGKFPSEGDMNAVSGIAFDSEGNKWATIWGGGGGARIAKIDPDTNIVYFYLNQTPYFSDILSYEGVVVDQNDTKFFGTPDGLIILKSDNWSRIDSLNSPVPGNLFENGYVDSKNNKLYFVSTFPRHNKSYGLLFYNEEGVVITSVEEKQSSLNSYHLAQNYPNPFNPTTILKFSLPERSIVSLKIYSILGREIKTLINDELPAGIYEKEFDGSGLSSGVYIYSIQANGFMQSKKMILLK